MSPEQEARNLEAQFGAKSYHSVAKHALDCARVSELLKAERYYAPNLVEELKRCPAQANRPLTSHEGDLRYGDAVTGRFYSKSLADLGQNKLFNDFLAAYSPGPIEHVHMKAFQWAVDDFGNSMEEFPHGSVYIDVNPEEYEELDARLLLC